MSDLTPYEALIWTSSHGTAFHHFPKNIERSLKENTNENKNIISKIEINAVPGRQTKNLFVAEMTQNFWSIPDETKRINVILMGDNDIRSNDYLGASRVEQNIGRIIELHKGSRHGLIVCGLLPSPATWKENDFLFHRVSNRLYKQVESANSNPLGRRIAFLKTIHVFTGENGLLDAENLFERDLIHLQQEGAYKLAKHLVDNIILIANTFTQHGFNGWT
jgi:hypothetical protein